MTYKNWFDYMASGAGEKLVEAVHETLMRFLQESVAIAKIANENPTKNTQFLDQAIAAAFRLAGSDLGKAVTTTVMLAFLHFDKQETQQTIMDITSSPEYNPEGAAALAENMLQGTKGQLAS